MALIFSWAFEITPEGIKLESEIEPSKSIAVLPFDDLRGDPRFEALVQKITGGK